MNVRRLARVLLVLLDVIVLAGSGVYLIVYLYRWEWNRAVVSGLFFLVAEVVLFAIVILGRLARFERRLDRLDEDGPVGASRWVRESGRTEPWRRDEADRVAFRWLGGGGEAVFVPVLLGVGAILSAIAYVVEHVASMTSPVRSEPLEARLSILDPPSGPLVPSRTEAPRTDDDLEARQPAGRASRAMSSIAVLLVVALLVATAVNTLADLAQNRPDPDLVGKASTYTLEIRVRDPDQGVSVARVADALWISCRGTFPQDVTASVLSVNGPYVRMRLDPAIAHNARRRFFGCLQDLTLDGALAEVHSFENVPSGAIPA